MVAAVARDRRHVCVAVGIGVCVFGAVGGAAVAGAQRAGADEAFTIYSSLPLQGDSRPQSADIARAMRMALRDNGGRAGRHRITYISLDDASPETGFWEPRRIAVNARKAAGNPHTIAYLGEFNSGASAVSMPILNRAGVLQVSPSNTIVGLTRAVGAQKGEPARYYPTGRRTYGRVIPTDHVQGPAVVAYMKEQGCASAYIINNRDAYGRGIAAQVERVGNRQGVPILGNDGIDATPANVRAAAARVTASGADCFFYGGFTQTNAVGVFKAVAAGAPHIRLFGPDGVAEAAFTEQLGPSLAKRVFITNPTLARTAYPPRGQRFFADFKARYGTYPEPYAIYGYEAMSVVLSSIRHADRAGTDAKGRRAVVDAFFAQKGRRSVLGTYDIDRYGDTTLPDYGGYRPVGGRLVFDKVLKITP
jgi:branched-chain amino acid transport system substrate-binding protein